MKDYIETTYADNTSMRVYLSGTIHWYKNGKTHKEDGPAVLYPNGSIAYYRNGKLHREDGPAVIKHDGTKYWFLDGEIQNIKKHDNIVDIDGEFV